MSINFFKRLQEGATMFHTQIKKSSREMNIKKNSPRKNHILHHQVKIRISVCVCESWNTFFFLNYIFFLVNLIFDTDFIDIWLLFITLLGIYIGHQSYTYVHLIFFFLCSFNYRFLFLFLLLQINYSLR